MSYENNDFLYFYCINLVKTLNIRVGLYILNKKIRKLCLRGYDKLSTTFLDF